MHNTDFILVLSFINYCILFHMNSCEPTFAHSCIYTNCPLIASDCESFALGVACPSTERDTFPFGSDFFFNSLPVFKDLEMSPQMADVFSLLYLLL